ncbi:hypothetical protein P6A00_001642 [Vibrio parahaemolyticus]|uniref:hypothetical protein n=1 Tax=Vibrio parahaemolyticus TaxID=670 RepID=UPI001A345655|nr:hypothetical protein [Vibrio parahaemolyticus]EGQ7798837.1 hypothetical protein [Vibrio parahaemolyticus]EGQ8110538.1 hypothetical protein [Vibrio parahaemolyticus]EGQ8198419.1 hypothetical protein [Vibrio parahaemolyticus]EGU0149851.1 hypothetical protein [Vibrio parahaemolyticus]EKQ5912417.1 hypothetical protein [Vibrio parahaemolyticus]
MDNFEQRFHDECKKVGVKDLSRLKYPAEHYLSVYLEMSENGKNSIGLKKYHLAVDGGEYKIAKAAYLLLDKKNKKNPLPSEAPVPLWYQQFIASTAGFAQDLWKDVSVEIQREVDERVKVSEAARHLAEEECKVVEEYLDEIIIEKEEFKASVEELVGYRKKNEDLNYELINLAREKSFIEDKLSSVIEDANMLRIQMTELQSLRVQVAKFEAELELKTQQVNDYRAILRLSDSPQTASQDTEIFGKQSFEADGGEV